MAEAANADLISRDEGKPAMAKLKMLPEVTSILNRQNLRNSIVDSEGGLLEGVRFFLEPLKDGSLPAYNIQRDIFVALSRLPMNKDALASSGIGKVVMFYTKTKKAEPGIRKAAEKLVGEWMRPILKRSDDFRKKDVVQADYDPRYVFCAAVFSSSWRHLQDFFFLAFSCFFFPIGARRTLPFHLLDSFMYACPPSTERHTKRQHMAQIPTNT